MMPPEKVAVIGAGYIGLTVACVLAEAGFRTKAVDIDADRVKVINSGRSPIVGREPGLEELIRSVIGDGMLVATTDIHECGDEEAFFVCVDTPVGEDRRPRLEILMKVSEDLGKVMRRGCLVSIESTLPPGTMKQIVIPRLEAGRGLKAGRDFHLVHCPERVMPGKLLSNVHNVNRVIGGIDRASIERAIYFYSKFVRAELHPTDLLTAEISKTAENAYRDVQIAFANEVALVCEEAGADAFEVRRMVNTCPFRDMHFPGAGVGGHCLTKDSWLLVSGADRKTLKVITGARTTNDSMPHHLARLAEEALLDAERPLADARISIMGLAFIKDSDETRNSPAKAVIDHFRERADLVVHDPFAVEQYEVPIEKSIQKALLGTDCAIFVTDHSAYQGLDLEDMKQWMRTPVIVDGRNLFDAQTCKDQGFYYRGIGKGRL
jgi:UDP-N-acetyl-D-mannosaminuronic acid dehydrogenase